jgi:hypothetical protein
MRIFHTFKERKNTSQFFGVGFHRQTGKWRARIYLHGKQTELGLFDAEEDAARAYNNAAILHHGIYATQNVLPSTRKETREGL